MTHWFAFCTQKVRLTHSWKVRIYVHNHIHCHDTNLASVRDWQYKYSSLSANDIIKRTLCLRLQNKQRYTHGGAGEFSYDLVRCPQHDGVVLLKIKLRHCRISPIWWTCVPGDTHNTPVSCVTVAAAWAWVCHSQLILVTCVAYVVPFYVRAHIDRSRTVNITTALWHYIMSFYCKCG